METTGTESARAAGDVAVDDAPPRRRVTRPRIAVVLLLLGVVVAFVPGLMAGSSFRPCAWIASGSINLPLAPLQPMSGGATPQSYVITGDDVKLSGSGSTFSVRASGGVVIFGLPIGRSTLCDLVAFEPGWTAAAAALLAMAPLYLWWRRGGLPFARFIGFAACVASAAAVCVFVLVPRSTHEQSVGGIWWTMPLGALLMAAAFLVAPAPVRSRED